MAVVKVFVLLLAAAAAHDAAVHDGNLHVACSALVDLLAVKALRPCARNVHLGKVPLVGVLGVVRGGGVVLCIHRALKLVFVNICCLDHVVGFDMVDVLLIHKRVDALQAICAVEPGCLVIGDAALELV